MSGTALHSPLFLALTLSTERLSHSQPRGFSASWRLGCAKASHHHSALQCSAAQLSLWCSAALGSLHLLHPLSLPLQASFQQHRFSVAEAHSVSRAKRFGMATHLWLWLSNSPNRFTCMGSQRIKPKEGPVRNRGGGGVTSNPE